MPFDGSSFRGTPRRRSFDLGAVLAAVICALLLLSPFSLAACSDMVRAWRGP